MERLSKIALGIGCLVSLGILFGCGDTAKETQSGASEEAANFVKTAKPEPPPTEYQKKIMSMGVGGGHSAAAPQTIKAPAPTAPAASTAGGQPPVDGAKANSTG